MKNILKHIYLLIYITIYIFSISCASPHNTLQPNISLPPSDAKKSIAYFDYFTYKGEDDYYKNNPLPGSDYFYNPILPGWYSDPSICSDGENYFMVTSTFSYFPGVPIFHSKDLVNWHQIGHVLNRASQLALEGQSVSGGIFAPAISYNTWNKTYYMITTNVGVGNFLVKTQDPFGEWSDPILLPNVDGIDPSLFFDDDGKAYIVHNSIPDGKPLYEGHRAIRIIEFDTEVDQTIGVSKVLVNGGVNISESPIWIEGPHLYKINGLYFLMAAEGGTGDGHSEVIFRSTSPVGNFTAWDKNPILTQRHLSQDRSNPVTCTGHADLIQAKEGDWWAVFLACRPIGNQFENLGRETFIMPVEWSDDGFPYMTRHNETVPMILRREGVTRESGIMSGNFEQICNFDSTALSSEWMTLRGSALSLYSMTDNAGYLSLKCTDISSMERLTPAFICRRMQHHRFEVTTRLYFEPADEKDAAGLLLFKDETHQYFFSIGQSGSEKKVSLIRMSASENTVLASHNIESDDIVNLKVVSLGTHYDFYYATHDRDWKLLTQNIDARYLSTTNAGGFTGATIGMYATRKLIP